MNNTPNNEVSLYTNLRKRALGITADQLESLSPNSESQVFGIMIDWESKDGLGSLVAYQSGDASIYLSEGIGIIGGGNFENVRDEVFSLLVLAQDYLGDASKIEEVPDPEKSKIRFIFFTKNGFYCAEVNPEVLPNANSKWGSLFSQAQHVYQALKESHIEQNANLKSNP